MCRKLAYFAEEQVYTSRAPLSGWLRKSLMADAKSTDAGRQLIASARRINAVYGEFDCD
jgi:hypothetical protein